LLDEDPGTTAAILVDMLRGAMPLVPNVILEYVDVRDVAELHIAAMKRSDLGGRRLLLSDESLSLLQIAEILRELLPAYARKLPRREMPRWMVRLLATADVSLRDARPFLGQRKFSDARAAIAVLDRAPTPARIAVIETALSIRRLGLA
jgi:nucleoside-diphosphate-sugar epimerase